MPHEGGEVCGEKEVKKCFNGYVLSAADSLNIFAQATGADTATLTLKEFTPFVEDGTKVIKHSFTDPKASKVISYEVQGMGHAWPPLKPQSSKLSGSTSKNLSATQIIWKHFGLGKTQ